MRLLPFLLLLLVGVSACTEDTVPVLPPPYDSEREDPMDRAELMAEITAQMGERERFDWSAQSDRLIFSAGVAEDSLFSLGYWLGDHADWRAQIGRVDTDTEAWRAQLDELVAVALEYERGARGGDLERGDLERGDLLVLGEPIAGVPQVSLRLSAEATVTALRAHPAVRYLEPLGFEPTDPGLASRSSKGCGALPNAAIPAADYVVVQPDGKSPWNFDRHRVREAQRLSQGAGVRVQIIDTGASDDQDNLGRQFAAGASSGRDIRKASTLYSGSWWWRSLEDPNDRCGHGTQMSGLAAAPRAGDGNAVGVAYRADLTAVRAVEDVFISSSNEGEGVRDALVLAGNDPSTRIVSMSIGTPFTNSTVADGVYYAHNRGKLLLAAAGTSLTWTRWYGVIFPASMPEVVAVTGVKEGAPATPCDVCHDGREVDFTIQMQRRGDDERVSLTLALSGDDPEYITGSSAATATTAGIAALVWSRHPGLDRDGVVERLARSGSNYPARDRRFGWGDIDALAAVR